VLYVLPTGGGKTVIFSYITERAARLGNRVCILVHRQELVDQTSRTLTEIGVEHGIIAAGRAQDLSFGVQVASVQTLARRLHRIPADFFQLLVVDEAHHAVAGSWSKVLDHYARAKILGVTATPERLDGRGLGDKFQAMVQGPDCGWLTDNGYLAPARVFAPPSKLDMGSVRKLGGDYRMDDAAAAMERAGIMGDAVTHYRRHLAHGTAIAFCCSVAHAQAVAEAFNAAGIASAVVDGTLHPEVRRHMIADLGTGRIRVLASCQIISEGTDVPSVTGAILLRPTQSLSLFLQQVGRCLRPAPGKAEAIILDHVGNTLTHGLPTDPREWSLDGRKRRQRDASAPPVKVCEQCFAAVPSAARACPCCGHTFETVARELKVVDGDLVEVDAEELRRIRSQERAQAQTLEDLQALAAQRGYSPGWAHHVWKARQNRHGRRAQQ
jgi:superfamily II DNA or RNA helicase